MKEDDVNVTLRISPAERLVSDSFDITRETEKMIARECSREYPSYPPVDKRLRLLKEQIRVWIEDHMPHRRVVSMPSGEAPSWIVVDHPNNLQGRTKGALACTTDDDLHSLAVADSVSGAIQRDSNGWPIHPNVDILLENGVVVGPGWYWKMGPNKAADPVLFRSHRNEQGEEELQVLFIVRKDLGIPALPGGMVDPNESGVSAALRELLEETGLELHDLVKDAHVVYDGVVADPRATLNAWPESKVMLFQTDGAESERLLQAGDDAKAVEWRTIDETLLKTTFASHGLFIQAAVQVWENIHKKVVSKTGYIGIAA